VQVLSAYFGRETRPTLPTPTPTVTKTATETATETATVDPSATATETATETATATVTPTVPPVMGPEEFAEQIAAFHQEGMGFGVLVKLYAMAEAAVKACASLPVTTAAPAAGSTAEATPAVCEAVTVEELVSQFQGGSGMGQLFKEFGKPALLGVGQVKKALKQQVTATPTPTVVTPVPGTTLTPVPSTAADSKVQNQNQKSNNGNGNSSSNGNPPAKVKTVKPKSSKK
jgi:hypothetical protein